MKNESAIDFAGNCRLHVALTVTDRQASKRFYELLLGEPRVKSVHATPSLSLLILR